MSTPTSPFNPIPVLSFQLKGSPLSKFSPRLGRLSLTRPDHGTLVGRDINIETPGLIASTTRGTIPHLTRDNVRRTPCIKWIHVPFESFLQVDPPIPIREDSSFPLHTFLGFSPFRHLLSLSLRDPADGREMPSNGNQFVAAQSSRGTRKVTCPVYRSYVTATLPDVVFSMSDIPFTSPPHSQRRIIKTLERSAQWLTNILAPINFPLTPGIQDSPGTAPASQKHSLVSETRMNVFVHMVGGTQPAARSAFATALLDPLEAKEKELVRLETLDEGVSGYVFDLVPIRAALLAEQAETTTSSSQVECTITDAFTPLIKASLQDLSEAKLRLVNTAYSPHEMLRLVRDCGVDLFDTFWAQQAATWGVALDFRFPVPLDHLDQQQSAEQTEKHQIGHNIYEERFAHDFMPLARSFLDGLEYSKRQNNSSVPTHIGSSPVDAAACSCAACSPTWSNEPLIHSTIDAIGAPGTEDLASPYTRAYVHHLLHTHEMSAHALLVMHNLTVMDAFMGGVRAVLDRERDIECNAYPRSRVKEVFGSGGDKPLSNKRSHTLFAEEVARFERSYDARLQVLDEAKSCWAEVDRARGKGRLARERAKAFDDIGDTPIVDGTSETFVANET